MKLSDFYYDLPKNKIAQKPANYRDLSKLLLLDLKNDKIEHLKFKNIIDLFNPGDTIVLNDTRVINARLFGSKSTRGKLELLILDTHLLAEKNIDGNIVVECLIKGRVRPGLTININLGNNQNKSISATILKQIEGGRFKVEIKTETSLHDLLSNHGHLPLPPYIKDELKIPERYQTVYSKVQGSVAAPTAGLHFTEKLLKRLKKKRINIAYLTLHISYGTFTPVRTENIIDHRMDREYAILDEENAKIINNARKSTNARLIAVGTTTVRTLETVAMTLKDPNVKDKFQYLKPWEGWTDLFIYPGFKFKSGIDILITNFHLPKSTLLMLVSAFAGREKIFDAYSKAIKRNYRFYSLGDAMMIIKE
ncbi:MAG: tRNA preQ1(34) S-adenosylmethionine ribosyltransferase-isomerase QueA [Candidatus Thorarchaeota archaeon]